jgi:hypothetical protein
MITNEHFDALQAIRHQAQNLMIACTAAAPVAALVHAAFDREAAPQNGVEERLLRRLRRIK